MVFLQAKSFVLTGIWKIDESKDTVLAAATNRSVPNVVRMAALTALAEMELPEAGAVLASHADKPNPPDLRSVSIRALAHIDLQAAAAMTARFFDELDLSEYDPTPTLAELLDRLGGAEAVVLAIDNIELSPNSAKQILRSLYSTGRSDESLVEALNRAIGSSIQPPDFSEDYVNGLVPEASRHGDSR